MDTKGGFYITQIKQLQDRIFEKLLTQHGIELGGGQGRILFILWKKGDSTIGELSTETSLAKNTVSIIVDGMVNKGILSKTSNPKNRRQTIVSLTEYACSIKQAYEDVSQEMNQLFYHGFSNEEQILFESYLVRILDTLTQAEQSKK